MNTIKKAGFKFDPVLQNVPYIFSTGANVLISSGISSVDINFSVPLGYSFVLRDIRIRTNFTNAAGSEFPNTNIFLRTSASSLNRQQTPVPMELYTSRDDQNGHGQVKTFLPLDYMLPFRDSMIWTISFDKPLTNNGTYCFVAVGVLVADTNTGNWGAK